jgi:ADP-ribosylglycohydrolase
MIGAIAGDMAGAPYEARPIKTKDFPFFGPGAGFTDDTVCSVAVADALLADGAFDVHLRRWARAYPRAGYGGMFLRWALSDELGAYGSWGNGAAMRVGPVGHAAPTIEKAMVLAAASAAVTHDHPEAVRGAQAVAAAIRFGLDGGTLPELREFVRSRFGYALDRSLDAIRPGYRFDVSCRGTVPPAILCVLEAADFEDAVRNAVSLGGDSDTLAAIAGSIAEAFFPVPDWIARGVRERLDERLWGVVMRFRMRYAPVDSAARAENGGRT